MVDEVLSDRASDDAIDVSRSIQRETGVTFHVATRFLPERVRVPTYVLYAFFREADEIVDDPDPPAPEIRRERLAKMRAAAHGDRPPESPVLDAFGDLSDRHGFTERDIEAFFDAMARDVDPSDFADYDALDEYLRGSAVAVGNMMCAVMDRDDPETLDHARALAEAFQLTNFLRDVREDVVDFDRVYLPESALAAEGLTPDDVRRLADSPALRAVIRSELRRTERRYRHGVDGIANLPDDCQFAVLAAAVLYAEHHRLIRAQSCDVVSSRPTLSMPRRLWVVAKTRLSWSRHGDPRTVFDRVSAVPAAPEDSPPGGLRSRLADLSRAIATRSRRVLSRLGVRSSDDR
ncbi:geranylgeranyl-diphosphate geranylgeranyltransferase [Halococcoides cellulosivorans]|uniref:Geranylgeranyl-diphosphate geranylgeranyltransferase n=2 Tax=Halococcoides cellulosivorans TaxID=1679096 RepID=A0A2R4X4M5_9EURY|nr:geranylgeranyl-diphosphate geranylgeranyltransferase [Halococcoides cellulosivorans]